MKYDPVTGQITLDISLGAIEQPKTTLKEIFEFLASSEQPCLVAIDEFQQIAEYPEGNVVALLRGFVQKCKTATFIFSGSRRRMMDKLFTNPSEPFYMSSSPLYLDVLDKTKYLHFSQSHFSAAGKALTDACFNQVYDTFEGHTWYVQRLLNEIFATIEKGGSTENDTFERCLNHVLKLEKRAFDDNLVLLPDMQKQVLIAVAKEGKALEITSSTFVKKHSLRSASSVQSAVTALYNKEYLTRTQEGYIVTNRFLRFYLLDKFAGGSTKDYRWS